MGENDSQFDNLKNELALAQLQKLNLEIESQRSKSKWGDRIEKYVPLATTFVAVAGLVFSIWQSQSTQNRAFIEQDRERINRIQNQIRADKEQLLEFTNNEKITASRLIFLLDDLGILIKQMPEPKEEELSVTNLLVSLAGDCNFNDSRQISFDIQALRRWKLYADYWKENGEGHNVLFNRYREAFLRLHDEAPSFFESMEYERGFYKVKGEAQALLMQRFTRLIEGYRLHLAILKQLQDTAGLSRQIEGFKLALNNPNLAKQLFDSKDPTVIDK